MHSKVILFRLFYDSKSNFSLIEDVIHHLETFDVTTVRASTPLYLLSRKIKASGVKMVLSGEGSDELLAGLRNLNLFILYAIS